MSPLVTLAAGLAHASGDLPLEALRQSLLRFEELVNSTMDGIITLDGDRQIILFNRAAEEIFGHKASSIFKHSFNCLLPERFRGLHPQLPWDKAFAGEISAPRGVRGSFTGLRANDEEFPMEASISQVQIDEQSFFTLIVRDVTERFLAEKELQSNEKRFRSLIENASDLITVINVKGLIDFQSPSVEPMLGYQPQDLVGRNALELVHPDDRARAEATYARDIANPPTNLPSEFRFRHRKGGWVVLQSVTRKMPSETGEDYIIVNSRDVTEQKQLEAQLRQAQKMEAIGQLAGGVAHDFNNLLHVISGSCELLALTMPLDAELHASVSAISHAAKRAGSLTRQLLAFSREQVVEPILLDLNESVIEAEKILRRLIGEDVNLAIILQRPLSLVSVDRCQIDQVILNLAVNARDAMPQGGGLTIETCDVELDTAFVKVHPEAKAGRHVLLAISDTGCGMTREVQTRIFEPFFTTKGPGKGTGLGLAVVHGIVKQSGGYIAVRSASGAGTTFQIYLPAAQGTSEVPVNTLSVDPIRGSETILLVEDEEPTRNIIVLLLHHLGYRVLDAASGEEALRLANVTMEKIHLVMTDVVMPGMSGRELADALRSRDPGLKVLFQSGYNDPTVVRRGMLQSDVFFLQKPFTLNSLASKVREILDRT